MKTTLRLIFFLAVALPAFVQPYYVAPADAGPSACGEFHRGPNAVIHLAQYHRTSTTT